MYFVSLLIIPLLWMTVEVPVFAQQQTETALEKEKSKDEKVINSKKTVINEIEINKEKEKARILNALERLEKGQCTEIIEEFQNYSFENVEHTHEQLLEVHRVLGICYVQISQNEKAKNEIQSIIYLAPDYTFDPLTTPPQVLEIHQSLLEEYQEKLQEFEKLRARQNKKEAKKKEAKKKKNKHRDLMSWPMKLAPFGGAQFIQNHNEKAIIFLFLEIIPLVVNIGAFWALQLVKDGPYQIKELASQDNKTRLLIEQILFGTHLWALGTFFLIYGTQIADAFIFSEE